MRLRKETAADLDAITALNDAAFSGTEESALIARLRLDGDLTLSLVAENEGQSAGAIVGHIALSPLRAPFPAFALAPLAVAPDHQRQGIGGALVHAAMAFHAKATIVVLGDPAYYARFGFRPVAWESPYAGPCLQAAGPFLPPRARIAHAPAFAAMV